MKLRWLVFPLGANFSLPSDKLDKKVAALFTTNTDTRQRYFSDLYLDSTPLNPLGQLSEVYNLHVELQPLLFKIKQAVKDGGVKKALGEEQIHLALAADIITVEEAKSLLQFDKKLMEIIHVDHFDEKELMRNTISSE